MEYIIQEQQGYIEGEGLKIIDYTNLDLIDYTKEARMLFPTQETIASYFFPYNS